VLRLGSIVLASVLLGVPRALESRPFGAQESVYVEVSALAPELQEFARELEQALARASFALAARRSEATTVVDVLGTAHWVQRDGRPLRAVALVTGHGRRLRPLVVDYTPGGVAPAVRELLACLSAGGRRDS
jgi:hypothetical protein